MSGKAIGPFDPIGTGAHPLSVTSQSYEEDRSLNTDCGHKENSAIRIEGAGDIRADRVNSADQAHRSSLPGVKKPFDPNRGKTGYALHVMSLRFHDLRLTQQEFAERFGFGLGSLRDLEQARGCPSRAARTLIEAIRLDPQLIERAAKKARRWGEW